MAKCDLKMKLLSGKVLERACDALVGFVFEGERSVEGVECLPKALLATLTELADDGEMTGKRGETTLLHCLDRPYRRLLLVGLGKRESFGPSVLCNGVGEALRRLRTIRLRHVAVTIPEGANGWTDEQMARAVSESVPQALYRFERYLHAPPPSCIGQVSLIVPARRKKTVLPGCTWGHVLGEAVNVTRSLCNEPANVLTPCEMAGRARSLARSNGLRCKILDARAIAREGMGLLEAVAAGSAQDPAFIVLEHRPKKASKRPLVALVGKGITYDSGGISLKQRKETMFGMKRDMIGGAIVIGLMQAVARMELDLPIVAVVPCAENMPSGTALRPGDIVRSMSGKYVEILNTDAEGRLVLADALTYLQKYHDPETILDIATIGGAPLTFGPDFIPLFSNEDALGARIERAAELTGELTFRLPLWAPYRKGIRSYFADLKNMSTTAPKLLKSALFLESFIDEGRHWAHLDIGGGQHFVSNKETGIFGRGATGKGMRLLAYLLDELAQGPRVLAP